MDQIYSNIFVEVGTKTCWDYFNWEKQACLGKPFLGKSEIEEAKNRKQRLAFYRHHSFSLGVVTMGFFFSHSIIKTSPHHGLSNDIYVQQ